MAVYKTMPAAADLIAQHHGLSAEVFADYIAQAETAEKGKEDAKDAAILKKTTRSMQFAGDKAMKNPAAKKAKKL